MKKGKYNYMKRDCFCNTPQMFMHMIKFFNKTPDAFEILKTRYVKGEISKEEYEKMRNDIS